jgi:hypothetical protein
VFAAGVLQPMFSQFLICRRCCSLWRVKRRLPAVSFVWLQPLPPPYRCRRSQLLDCMYAQQILLLAWPPRPMPVRQSWVESVLASGGYGSYSIQFNGIYFLSLRAGQRAPAAAAAADTAFLRRSCTVCMSAHSTVRKALRRSCTISRFLEKLHELRFASPTLLPRLLYSTVMYHIDIHRPRIY